MYAGLNSSHRVTSPTMGRPSTPSLATAVSRGALRPASALGHAGERSMHADEDSGEWITITSKFHFVDLAGSERVRVSENSLVNKTHIFLAKANCCCW